MMVVQEIPNTMYLMFSILVLGNTDFYVDSALPLQGGIYVLVVNLTCKTPVM